MSLLKNFKSWYKGWDGELTVKLMQWMYLDKNTYHVFNNVILPKFGGGISQILKIPEEKFHSVIMFIGDCELKTNMPENVLLKGYTKYIKNKTNILLTENEVGSIIEGIKAYQLPSNFKSKTEHIQHVKSIKENKPYSTL